MTSLAQPHASAPADTDPTAATADTGATPARGRTWAKRFGTAAFLFFLIKGLLWLAVPPLLILGARLFN